MKITVIYGTNRTEKSSTYNIAQQFLAELADGDPVTEFHLPKDMPKFCKSCSICFTDETKCPDYDYLKPIVDAVKAADLVIFTVPVYVYHAPGQVKAFLDHCAYLWMPHRPEPAMFKKQALIISTAAGAGMKSAVKDVKDSLDFWGIAKTWTLKKAVQSSDWETVTEKRKTEIAEKVDKTAGKIRRCKGAGPRLKVKLLFYWMRSMQKRMGFSKTDVAYWKENGWLAGKKPWKRA